MVLLLIMTVKVGMERWIVGPVHKGGLHAYGSYFITSVRCILSLEEYMYIMQDL